MWFHLAWFGSEFRTGEVRLITNEVASVSRFIEQGRDFTSEDIQAMVEMQYRMMRAVIPVHRHLQERGQIEIATTPFSHPILPLLVDTDLATIDRPGASYPRRFSHPEDADAQVRLAIESYQQHFGRLPQGMWPAEGAVSQQVVPIFARHGIRWIATDKGVLARSGRWGYTVDDPNVLCQPYCVQENEQAVSIFFRDTHLSDAIGFRYAAYGAAQAAQDFLQEIKERFVRKIAKNTDRVITVILDGENAWGAYRDDARPFLHALYKQLGEDQELRTVTFAEYLTGNQQRGIAPHPLEEQACISDLFTGSWIDENGSAPGVDLGTWIGEREENRGWDLLGQTRDDLDKTGVTTQIPPAAFEAMYIAEGSDWFWWLGEDQDSVNDSQFDDLFRTHLKQVYRCLRSQPPAELDQHIVPHTRLWTFTHPLSTLEPSDRLTIRTNCPGMLTWSIDGEHPVTVELKPAGGVMAGAQRYSVTIGPIPKGAHVVRFRFSCTHADCSGQDKYCCNEEYTVAIEDP